MTNRNFAPTVGVAVPIPQWATAQAPERLLTVAELLDEYIAAYTGKDPTVGWRLETWRRLLGARAVLSIKPSDIRDALKQIASEPARAFQGRDVDGKPIHRARSKPRSGGTLNRYHAGLSSVFQWAIDHALVPDNWPNPCRGIRRAKENPGVVRFLEPDERRRLLDACRASVWPRMYGLALLALTSGGRRGELLGLRWRDIDFEQCVAHLRQTKNGEPRVLVLVPAVIEELNAYPRGKPDDLVFRATHDPSRPYSIEKVWRTVLASSKVERFRFHDLRHSFASALAQEGASLIELADAMGHKSMAMVRRYAHLSAKSRAALVNRVMGGVR